MRFLLSLLLAASATAMYPADDMSALIPLRIDGEPAADASALAKIGDRLLVAVDEGRKLYLFRRAESNAYESVRSIDLHEHAEGDDEHDFEGIAVDGEKIFVVGSHSVRRKSVDPKLTAKENRKRLAETELQPHRSWLFRFELTDDGRAKKIQMISLRKLLEKDEYLARFVDIPSKENGIDIEGLATDGKRVYLGFRGPVLRGNFVPVMVLEFDEPDKTKELRFVKLKGRGIRSLTRCEDGFLIIAGPMGSGRGDFFLYRWDGRDCVPGTDRKAGKVERLAKIDTPDGASAEGLELLEETADEYRLLVLFDSKHSSALRRETVKK